MILPDTELGTAMLIVEDEDGNYEPIGFAATLNEALEAAKEDLRNRERLLLADQETGLCPWEYKVWARGLGGKLVAAATWNASEL